ncbi:LOW QUALITY PROTEIN: probable acyl-activating enzyme 5, peroxisomal [Cucurbita pepo subsp. pepo]|uniref:LOW QUALITY PROTEIN: probable acyl-activating enzyme 5, peroxisomal n=1 Tax=Cucurbita pepo subsp. pepo TaxID=3664 RepID=UPI000C9D3EF1|nr:LOW QUALITY PROTEIN: probable acyl-activating enzyme 5, peroxisomal [Cucurbita pepo subsp. pepo]
MEELKPRPANFSPLTPLGFLERAATIYGDSPSIIYAHTTYTWSETHHRCLQLASSLSSAGIQRGHVVSVISPNTPPMYELHFAVPMAGAILNTISTRLDARTISVLLCHSESKLIFVDQAYYALIQDALALFPPEINRPMLVLIADDAVAEESSSSVLIEGNFVGSYEEMIRKGDSDFRWIRPASEWDPIVLNYTSGTTSSPKGVVHCHRGIFIVTLDMLLEWGVPKQSTFLWTLPMFHINGWSLTWGMAAVGGTNICIRKFDAALIYSLIRRHHVTHMCAAPVVLNMLTNSLDNRPLDRPVKIFTGGAPPPAAVLSRIETLGFDVTHGYGLTETAGIVTCCSWKAEWNRLPATEHARLKARQGVRTAAMAAVDVVDLETGKSVKQDGVSIGEIVLRGGTIMIGYWKDGEATAKSMTEEGWFHTGDVGVMHPDGYLEIKDRSKDVIISGGENLSSVEVESILYTNPSVNEAAVVARLDEFWGETPCAFVSLREGLTQKPTEEEIIEYCRGKLPRFMAPKTVVFMTELPKTSTGKIQKYLLREMTMSMGPTKRSSKKN